MEPRKASQISGAPWDLPRARWPITWARLKRRGSHIGRLRSWKLYPQRYVYRKFALPWQPVQLAQALKQWAGLDSNQGPRDYESPALIG